MGRPVGTRNLPNHRAGGDRRSAKWKQKQQRGNIREAFAKSKQATKITTYVTPKLIDHPLCEKNFQASQKLLADVLDHPSMPKGKKVPTMGIISDNGSISYPNEPSEAESDDKTFYRRKYMPEKGTPLRTFLDKAAEDIKKNDMWKRRKYYYQTLDSPLTYGLGSMPTPDKFYLPELIRIWWPKHQFHSIDFKYKCPRCKGDSVESNGITWRPAFEHNEIRWIFCHEIKCTDINCKGHTFNSTDPSFLSMLPSCIAGAFEFVFPPQGPGVSRVMLRRLSLQLDNHVLFGAWVREVNDLMWENYLQKCNQYYELLNDWLEKWPPVTGFDGRVVPLHATGYDGRPMVPYSAFGESGHHNGIMMTEGLAKTLFRLVEGGKRFEYNQSSFAAWHDEGIRADDTYKICKKVFLTTSGRKRVNPYSGLMTMLSQQGKIVAAVWKTSMTHDTNRKVLEELKVARDHVGAPPLKLLQTDNPVGEQAPYYEVFPELTQGVTSRTSLPMIEIPSDHIAFFDGDDPTLIDTYILSFADLLPENKDDIYYGLDTEFERDQTLTVLSLAFPQSIIGSERDERLPVAIVVHLHKIRKSQFPDSLRRLLEQPNMIPVGRQIGGDCNKLEDQYGIHINRRIELQNLCKTDRDLKSYGLKSLMEEYLQCTYPMNKSTAQVSSYSKAQLTDVDKQYCALDAAVSLWVGQRALASLAKAGQASDLHPTLQEGKRCIITHNNREIAAGRLQFVGARGEQRRWGDKRLGRSDCLVSVESLIVADFEPRRRNSSWPKTATTLRDLLGHEDVPTLELAVTVNQVKIVLEDGELSSAPEWNEAVKSFEVDRQYVDTLIQNRTAESGVRREADAVKAGGPPDESAEQEAAVKDPPKDEEVDGEAAASIENDDSSEGNNIFTRSLKDLFHQITKMPVKKNAEEKGQAVELVLAATWINNEEEYEAVVEVLQNKGVEDIAMHEYFHRSYWRTHVRRHTPQPLDHANNIRLAKHEIWTRPGFERIRTKELDQWFEEFAMKAEDGLFYIPREMKIYKLLRVDSDGLPVYTTDFGTNLNESLHQKYADLVGPFAVGVETADVLLVLRSFRFNIGVGISRYGEPDFHTDRHDIVDKTQHWMMQIFATWAWPTHKNLLDFNPPKTAALVGLRPVQLNPQHVKLAESPDAGLSQDHRYLSKKLGVAIAPLPLSTKEEFQMYNTALRKIVAAGRRPNADDWDNLAREFFSKTNGKTIFPKTEDLLKKYYHHWKLNQSKRLFAKRINLANSSTYQQLRNQKMAGAAPGLVGPKLPSHVDNQFYTSKRPLDEKPNVVPPAAAYNQSHHVNLKTKRQRKSRANESLSFADIKEKPTAELGKSSNRCAWYPLCQRQVWRCGGITLKRCKFINAEHKDGRITAAEIERRKQFIHEQKKEEAARVRRRQRTIKKIIDKATKPVAKTKSNAPLDTSNNTMLTQPKVIDLIEDIVISADQYLSQESVAVPAAHNSEESEHSGHIIPAKCLQELATPTLMIDDEVVNAYLGLIVDKCHYSRKRDGVGATHPGFWQMLRNKHYGWEGAQRHLCKDHRVNLIPTFWGARSAGHWAALVVDSTCSSGRRRFVYFDSLPMLRAGNFRVLKQLLCNWESDDSNFVLMDSPIQDGGSNDCAVFTLAAFVHFVFRTGDFVPSKLEKIANISAIQYGIGWRRHVYKSIVNQRIDLTDDVFGWSSMS